MFTSSSTCHVSLTHRHRLPITVQPITMVNDAEGFVFIAAGRVSDITRPLYLPFQPKGCERLRAKRTSLLSSCYDKRIRHCIEASCDAIYLAYPITYSDISLENFIDSKFSNKSARKYLKKIIHRNVNKTYFSRKSSAIISPLINSKVLFSIPREVNVPRLSPPPRYKTRHAIEESIEGLKRATGFFHSTRVLPKRGVTRGSREEEGKRRGTRDSLERRFPVPPPCKSFIPLVAGLLHGGYCITGLNI